MNCPLTGPCSFREGRECGAKRCRHLRLVRMAIGERIQRLVSLEERSPGEEQELRELKKDYAETLRQEGAGYPEER